MTGRPRSCDHHNRRSRMIVRRGKSYTITFCRTCENDRERERRHAIRLELETLRASADTVSGT